MPKILENIREQLLSEAKKQISQRGYADTTVRSVAAACGVGVGTVYNYFPSKELLIATFVYEDWKTYLQEMSQLSFEDPKVFFRGIYDLLQRFSRENEVLFSDAEAAKLAAAGSSQRHRQLRSQIAAVILPLCRAKEVDDPQFSAEFLAEGILCWSMEQTDFEVLYPFLENVLKK